ncbi:hypothetical protein MMC27_000091 [Xylographa pallens]|nr:hypothetical protein [Xylographa pallens]
MWKGSSSHSELLLAHGADANISDLVGNSPFHVSAIHNIQVLTLLQDLDVQINPNHYGQWPIHWASQYDEAHQNLELLLRWGCDSNVQDAGHKTPLHRCSRCDAYRNATLLLQYGADANLFDELGLQPWQSAILDNSGKTLNVLLRHGSDLTGCTPQRETVLHLAAQYALQPVVDILEKADLSWVDADAVNNLGYMADDFLRFCLQDNHTYRPGCSLELHDSIQQLIDKIRTAKRHVREISDVEESTSDNKSEAPEDDLILDCESSDDGESSYEDALEA